MSFYYAQLDDDGKTCIGISDLSGEVEADNMIQITAEQYAKADLIGKIYEDGAWIQ